MTINVGILGFGNVGSGTVKILLRNRELIKKRTGIDINIKRIADIDIKKDRGVSLSEGILTEDVLSVIDDPAIDIIVELIGGIETAKEFIIRALKNKKHVVTANKALLAEKGDEIFEEARRNNVLLGFEGSVAGGIPILRVIREGLVGDRIVSIYGIINGTSNYILTKMTEEKISFDDALIDAQRKGYAEADPSLDVGGVDAAHKLAILSTLAFGIPFSYRKIYKEGITGITPMDIEFASELGFKIKLLAITKIKNHEIELRVHPTMVPLSHLISQVNGVFNAVYVEGESLGPSMYYGRGAGDMPTGTAVVSDIVDISKKIVSGNIRYEEFYGYNNFRIMDMGDVKSMYYFRFTAIDRPGVLSKISGVLGENNISIASVIQKGRRSGGSVPLVILTHTATEKDVRNAIDIIDKLPVVSDRSFILRVEGKEEDIIK